MRVAFATLGCKVNQYDTEAMRELFEDAGYACVDFDEEADIYVINTCTVTQIGDKKSRQMISRAHMKNPHAHIVVTGCYSQRAPDEVKALRGVDLVLGTLERRRIVALTEASLQGAGGGYALPGAFDAAGFEPLSASREGRTRAHLKIQDGCDRFCSYCIIPYARGRVRSRPLDGVLSELDKLARAGYREVVLTGIHLMSYGKDLPGEVTLRDALVASRGIGGIQRIRLGSLEPEPQLMGDDFILALAEDGRICRHFHLSLQSGSQSVLQRMNRRYSPDEYALSVERLRAAMPHCAITTDIIAGFPGETDEEFNETLAFTRRMGFARIHVFPYSRRKGTRAYDMPDQIPHALKAERTSRLIALGSELEQEYLASFSGKAEEVLFEERKGPRLAGRTGTYVSVEVECDDDGLIGEIRTVCDLRIQEGRLTGRVEV